MMSATGKQRAIVAFGSNMGNRVVHIENALDAMREAGLEILRTSRLYYTKAMYVQDQADFLNGAALIETDLQPLQLLDVLQGIEMREGRKREVDKGPRTLDLDIILYGPPTSKIDHERLKVPHPLFMEREFVLRPLADIVPDELLPYMDVLKPAEVVTPAESPFSAPVTEEKHHVSGKSSSDLDEQSSRSSPQADSPVAKALKDVENTREVMRSITYLGPGQQNIMSPPINRPTRIMSIMNITPDSFSDGGKLSENNLETIIHIAKSHIEHGADILDIGGQSTRPKATLLSADQELARVLPVLRAIRTIPEVQSGEVAVSIDTFYSFVARACSEEGLVDIINDISAGQLDPDKNMLKTVAKYRKTVVLMHMRGTPETMSQPQFTNYAPSGVLAGVGTELSQRLDEALKAGIPPWRIILDPGVGFAKSLNQNLALIRQGVVGIVQNQPHQATRLAGYPWLFGVSRKGFIGKITGEEAADGRALGTAVSVAASIAGGADIVRIHDTEKMSQVVRMADAIHRGVHLSEKRLVTDASNNTAGVVNGSKPQ